MADPQTFEVVITLPSGQAARLHAAAGGQITIRSPEPSPPGSTVRGTIEGVACEFQLKVRSCKRHAEAFEIQGRLQNATRELSALLQAEHTRSGKAHGAQS